VRRVGADPPALPTDDRAPRAVSAPGPLRERPVGAGVVGDPVLDAAGLLPATRPAGV
jgi:hypothetical protein